MLEKALENSFTASSFIQSILKEISPEYSLERLMLKLNDLREQHLNMYIIKCEAYRQTRLDA